MGHLGHLKEEYRELVERLEAGTVSLPAAEDPRAEAARREILEILYTPEEAALAARMPVRPASLERIAKRLNVDPKELEPKLDAMARKGLVMDIVRPKDGRVKYMLSPPVVGFFEFSLMRAHDEIPKKRIAEALDAYSHGDPAFAQEVFGKDTVVGRAMVHETAIDEETLPDILAWEKATAMIEDASALAVSLCYCRHKQEHLGEQCDAPMDNCVSLNAGADFVIRREFGRKIEKVEALEILSRSRESGLVQIADNVQQRPAYMCNCCGCCCGQLAAINEFDLFAVNPSGYEAKSDTHKCTGCSRCSRACPIGAISMVPKRVAAKRKSDLSPRIDLERCIGCGVCVGACRKDAMQMVPRAKRPHVPVNAVERSVRMAIERGRLPHLIADEGESRGSKFLNRVLQTLCSLPPAEQALANAQVQSVFLRYVLGTVKDPTAPR